MKKRKSRWALLKQSVSWIWKKFLSAWRQTLVSVINFFEQIKKSLVDTDRISFMIHYFANGILFLFSHVEMNSKIKKETKVLFWSLFVKNQILKYNNISLCIHFWPLYIWAFCFCFCENSNILKNIYFRILQKNFLLKMNYYLVKIHIFYKIIAENTKSFERHGKQNILNLRINVHVFKFFLFVLWVVMNTCPSCSC